MMETRSFAPHLPCPNRPLTTGSWRTFRPIINQENAICVYCAGSLPDGAMKRDAEVLGVDLDFVKGADLRRRMSSRCHIDGRGGLIMGNVDF